MLKYAQYHIIAKSVIHSRQWANYLNS